MNIAKFPRTALFTEHLRWLLLKGSIMDSFTGKFPDRGNLYQQLALGHSIKEGVRRVCLFYGFT